MKKLSMTLLLAVLASSFLSNSYGKELKPPKPLIPPIKKWDLNQYCKMKKVGKRNFYVGTLYGWHASWYKLEDMKAVGLDKLLVPGSINVSLYNPETKNSEKVDKILQMTIDQQLPFHSCEYHAFKKDSKTITEEAKKKVGELWYGDSHPEYAYRFDFILPAVRGENSSWLGKRQSYIVKYYLEHAVPVLKKKLPFYKDKSHKWTRHDYYVLSEIQQDVTFREVGLENALPWHMNGLGFYYIASQPGNRAVADKSAKHISAAHCRGAMRQFGGNKSWVCWLGYEPPRMLNYQYSLRRGGPGRQEEFGYPYSHSRLHIYLPYLAGINFYKNEFFYSNLIDDVEQDGQIELSPLGQEFKKMMDLAKRHPDRGMAYTPVALMMDWEMTLPGKDGRSYGRYLPFENCDQMNQGILYDLLYPEVINTTGLNYFDTAPMGDIFDVIKPNAPGKGIDPKALENYKVLFTMGGLQFNKGLTDKIENFVKEGGSFVINVEDIKKNFSSQFTGVQVLDKTKEVKETRSLVNDKVFTDKDGYTLRLMKLEGAKSLYVDTENNPVITRFKYGRGYVFVVAAEYMITNKGYRPDYSALNWKKHPLVSFTEDFFSHLTSGLLPVEVLYDKDQERKIAYKVSKKGDGWVVTLINYSFKRGPLKAIKYATSKVKVIYPPTEVPVKLICNFPVGDALEWSEDRDIEWKDVNGKAVIDTSIASGQFKIIELQPEKIKLKPVERYVNYALKRPVKVSSFAKGHEGEQLVDGNTDRDNGWWSENTAKGPHRKKHRKYDLPQVAIIALEEPRIIDHISILFYYFERERLEKYGRPRYTQFYVGTSLDGKKWDMVFDERKNIKTSFGDTLERWFKPRKALYVKLTVTYNSMLSGAQVIEMGVYGPEKELYNIKRKPADPGKITFPIDLKSISPEKISYLIDVKPKSSSSGWLPVGNTVASMCGPITLRCNAEDPGKFFPKSLYAQACSEYTYDLDGKYKYFVAVAGLGAPKKKGNTVTFKVLVDGVEKFNSGLFKAGRYPIPVFIDVEGKKKLQLIVDDAGDGIRNDYAWWGDARLIKK